MIDGLLTPNVVGDNNMDNMFSLDENYAINLNYLEEVLRYYDDDDDDNPYSLRLTINGRNSYQGYSTKEKRDNIYNMLVSGNKESGILK